MNYEKAYQQRKEDLNRLFRSATKEDLKGFIDIYGCPNYILGGSEGVLTFTYIDNRGVFFSEYPFK